MDESDDLDDVPPDRELTEAEWDALSDEEWDRQADREMDAAAGLMVVIGPRLPPPPREPAFRWPPPPREYDRRCAVLTPDGVGEFLRACRAAAGLSQRQVCEAAGIPQRTLARLEAGDSRDVKLSTLVRLAQECDVMLVGTTAGHVTGGQVPLLETDLAQRHHDRAGRWLPAHLHNEPRLPRHEQFLPRYDRNPTARCYSRTPVRDVPDD